MDYEKVLVEETGFCKLIRVVCSEMSADFENGNAEITKDLACERLNNVYRSAVEKKRTDLAFTEYFPIEMNGYQCAREYLKHIFLEEKIGEEITGHLLETETAMNELLSSVRRQGQGPFPAYSLIEKYLMQYYELLKAVLKITGELKDAGEAGTKFIQNILNIGLEFPVDNADNTGKGAYASLYAPGVLNGVARLYGALEEYGKCAVEITAKKVRENYQEVLISKVLRYFNWFIVQDGEIMRVEMPACLYEKRKDMEWSLNIPIRPLKACNSYEGIGELRLLDKVLYEIERLGEKEKNGKKEENIELIYNIAVVGDVESKPMDQLCKTVKYYLSKHTDAIIKELKVIFTVLTYNEDDREHLDDVVNYVFKKYDNDLSQADKLIRLVENNDLIFLLDCCDLYNKPEIEQHDRNLIWQKVANNTYIKDYDYFQHKKNFIRNGCFSELIEELYVFNYSGKFGKWHKKLNESELRFLCNYSWQKQNNNKEKSIYAYISDMAAFNAFDYKEQQIIRIENYNDKQIAILRISDYEEDELKVEVDKKLIVFTLWQLIKHIAIRNIDRFLESFGLPVDEARSGILSLREALVGVDYSNWPERLNFYYQMPKGVKDDEFRERLEECIKVEVMPFFKDGTENMFSEYFITSFSSFLYGDAKNVNDMLFLHLFKNCHSLLKEVELINKERKDLEKYQRQRCKYSQKQYYYEMMKDYDTSSGEFAFKYTKLWQLEQNEPELRKKIFGNIKQACEENSYTDSYLYRKCK